MSHVVARVAYSVAVADLDEVSWAVEIQHRVRHGWARMETVEAGCELSLAEARTKIEGALARVGRTIKTAARLPL